MVAVAVDSFLAELRELAAVPSTTVDQLVELLYSERNPLLDPGPTAPDGSPLFEGRVIPGRGFVTARTLADPGYREQLAVLDELRARRGTFDPAASEAAHTMTPKDAARELGVSESAIRGAITSGRLPAVRRDGRWFLRPEAVDGYAVELRRRGPVAEVVARVGSVPGAVLNLRTDGRQVEGESSAGVKSIRVLAWRWIAVRTIDKGDGEPDAVRFYELAPGGGGGVIALGPLGVEGRYRIVREERNSRRALEAWKATRAE